MHYYNIGTNYCIGGKHDASVDDMVVEIKTRMKEANVRRIKRSLIFNIKSFSFLESADLEKFNHFQLIKPYLEEKITLLSATF